MLNRKIEKIKRWEVFGSSGPEIGLGSNTRLLSRNNTLEIIRVNSDNEGTDQYKYDVLGEYMFLKRKQNFLKTSYRKLQEDRGVR